MYAKSFGASNLFYGGKSSFGHARAQTVSGFFARGQLLVCDLTRQISSFSLANLESVVGAIRIHIKFPVSMAWKPTELGSSPIWST